MRIVFIGCVEVGLEGLKQIIKDGWDVAAIFTLAKKYAAKTSGFVDFAGLAKKNGIRLFKVRDINEEENLSRMRRLNPDLTIVCGWQRLVSKEMLEIPVLGAVGFHSSLLPKYRGRAPVNWAIIMGEKRAGVTMFFCEPQADTGDIIAQESFPITLGDTCATVYAKAAKAICKLIHDYLPKIERGRVKRIANLSRKSRLWPKRDAQDGLIDWSRSALEVHNWIRALTRPYPGAFTFHRDRKYFIWGSRLGSEKLKAEYRPGEIIKRRQDHKKAAFLVAAGSGNLWVLDIAPEVKTKYGLKTGDVFGSRQRC